MIEVLKALKGEQGIKGEDGKDGEDGKVGSNGSSGSKGDKGETAYSNTILPSKSGYILPSKGSALVGEDITFTFVPETQSSEETKEYVFSVLNNKGEEATDLNKDDNPLTFETTMEEGGFVVSINEITTTTVTSDTEFLKALTALEEGDNYIYIEGIVDLTEEAEEIQTFRTNSLFDNTKKGNNKNKIDISVK